ncbi:chromate transporter-domain-containing protein [Lipomyces arxii]|uniref:chromate transporter-domain-containing protein n=1 Tax=Lipomyces arxii TaxID=56418 RepID=UPI0034CEFE7B
MLQNILRLLTSHSFFSKDLKAQLAEMSKYQWHMGISSFGGPVVQFQNFNRLFVEKYKWLNDETYQELFAVAQALPGSASTKLLFIITLLHSSIIPAIVSFLYWALPGAIGMFVLALGVGQIGDTLPIPVYALLSGLNSATVGVIFVAAIQLSTKAITDKLSLALIFLGGAAGVCYTALWYFPVLMVLGGAIAVIYDLRFIQRCWARETQKIRKRFHRKKVEDDSDAIELNNINDGSIWLPETYRDDTDGNSVTGTSSSKPPAPAVSARRVGANRPSTSQRPFEASSDSLPVAEDDGVDASNVRAAPVSAIEPEDTHNYNVWLGVSIVVFFLATFVTVMVLRAVVKNLPITYMLFSNLYLAGTIIFGGGPVVIPLLREYVVAEGWVSARDFTIGLALIQAFPGPNFNFAIYLGALTYHNAGSSSFLGAVVSFIAFYTPGMLVAGGMFTFWHKLRRFALVTSLLRGVNSAAIGLVWTAVYRIWESGFLSARWEGGISLGEDPWWIVCASTAFVLGSGWGCPAPISIFIGGLMGIIWWAVTGAHT